MAKFNEILVGRFNKLLIKMFSMKGQAPAPQLASEITPSFTFLMGVETRYLEGWNRFSGSLSAGPVAAQTDGFQLRNPVNSGVVAVIEQITISISIAGQCTISQQGSGVAGDLINTFTGFRVDPRGNPTSSCIISSAPNI